MPYSRSAAFGVGPFQAQRRVHGRASLHAQQRLIDEPPIVRFRRFALGAAKCLGHPHEVVLLRFRYEPREREQLASLLPAQSREARAVRFERAQHTNACFYVVGAEIGGWRCSGVA